jgi:hypothetical protein
MSAKLSHLYLRNPFGYANRFNKSRYVSDTEIQAKDPEVYRAHKEKLNASFIQLTRDRIDRLNQKTLVVANIEIVEILFLIPFSDGSKFKTRTRFLREFGERQRMMAKPVLCDTCQGLRCRCCGVCRTGLTAGRLSHAC